jgi:hypothetical protein
LVRYVVKSAALIATQPPGGVSCTSKTPKAIVAVPCCEPAPGAGVPGRKNMPGLCAVTQAATSLNVVVAGSVGIL